MFHSYLRLCRFSILQGASRLWRNSYHGNSSSKETNWPELCLKRSVVGSFWKYLRFYEMTYILKLKMISGLKVHKIITPGRKVRLKECCQLPRGDSTHNNFEWSHVRLKYEISCRKLFHAPGLTRINNFKSVRVGLELKS